jgi:hypothetical protein
MAKELELGEDVIGWGCVVHRLEVGIVVGRHGDVLCRIGRAHRGLRGDHPDGRPAGPAPLAAGAKRRTAGRGFLASRGMPAQPAGEESRRTAVAGPAGLLSDRP